MNDDTGEAVFGLILCGLFFLGYGLYDLYGVSQGAPILLTALLKLGLGGFLFVISVLGIYLEGK